MRLRALMAATMLALAPGLVTAQDQLEMGQVQSPILTVDVDRLLAETLFGQQISHNLRERTEALSAENESLREQLTAEERALTDRRPTMEVEAFRAEADAFDARVQAIRAEQDAKQRELEEAVAQGRDEFLNTVTPVLARLMIDSGAAVILERRDVFLSVGLVDITNEAIIAIDAQLGDGTASVPGADLAPVIPEVTPTPETDPPSLRRPPAPPATLPTIRGQGTEPLQAPATGGDPG